MKLLITTLVLVSVLVQTVFGGLQDSVVICLGGGHDHEPPVAQPTAAPACCTGCSHNDEWPAPAEADEHSGDCGCTDIELALFDLLATPRLIERDVAIVNSPTAPTTATVFDALPSTWRGPPLDRLGDPTVSPHAVGQLRLAMVRTTRLLI
jgi:hypothetical protein